MSERFSALSECKFVVHAHCPGARNRAGLPVVFLYRSSRPYPGIVSPANRTVLFRTGDSLHATVQRAMFFRYVLLNAFEHTSAGTRGSNCCMSFQLVHIGNNRQQHIPGRYRVIVHIFMGIERKAVVDAFCFEYLGESIQYQAFVIEFLYGPSFMSKQFAYAYIILS